MSNYASEHEWRKAYRRYVANRYLEQELGEVEIPFFFVRVMRVMLAAAKLAPKRELSFSIATTILRMVFEAHERVPLQDEIEQAERKNTRQLLVLAGDFYSGLFYRLLADNHELAGLKHFSCTIRSINESRLNLHLFAKQERCLSEAVYSDLQSYTSGLLASLADFFHVEKDSSLPWKQVVSSLLLVQFIAEKEKWFDLLTDSMRNKIYQEWQTAKDALQQAPDCEEKHRLCQFYTELAPWVDEMLLTEVG
jgi:hypothetical protein